MSTYPVFVAFYFDRAPKIPVYEQGAKRLIQRCTALGIPHDVCKEDLWKYMETFKKRNPRTTTERRVVYRYIPEFITKKLRQHNKPILYIHCDSAIIRRPDADLFEPNMSVGISANYHDTNAYHVFASPLFFRPDNVAYTFLNHWTYMCQNFNTDESEHIFLGHAVKAFSKYPELKNFRRQISSEIKSDDPDILFGQALNKLGEAV